MAADFSHLAGHAGSAPLPNIFLSTRPDVAGNDCPSGGSGASVTEPVDGVKDRLPEGHWDEWPDQLSGGVTPHGHVVPDNTAEDKASVLSRRRVLGPCQGSKIDSGHLRMARDSKDGWPG